MKTNFAIFFSLLIMLLAACVPTGATTNLHGTTWKLVSYGANATPAVVNANATLNFDKDGKVSGNVGCNSFSGDYSLSGDKITFGPIASTLMACSDELMRQEGAVFSVLNGTFRYMVEAGLLTIFSPDDEPILTFTQVQK